MWDNGGWGWDQHGKILTADLCIYGVWLPRAEVLFDIHVFDTDDCHICTTLPAEFCVMQKCRRISMQMLVYLNVSISHPILLCWWFSNIWGQSFLCRAWYVYWVFVGTEIMLRCWGRLTTNWLLPFWGFLFCVFMFFTPKRGVWDLKMILP